MGMKINNPANGDGNCYTGMGGNGNKKTHSRTPLILSRFMTAFDV